MKGKKTTGKKNFYLPVLNELKVTTNLTKIKDNLGISKQQLNYYLRELKKKGFVINKDTGWWELTEKGKNPTKYGIFLKEDDVRGHAYIWEIELENIPEKWDKRIKILEKKGVNFKLVGALKTTPRIKILGRKIWLCNNHIRIYDTEKSSYYGKTSKESRINSKFMALKVIKALENKLGIRLTHDKIKFKKEHYALIKNQLAIDQNQKGVVWRIKDDNNEEWLLIDDSLEQGGELETVGKKAFKTNPKLQNWWNEQKETDFKVTPTFILNALAESQGQLLEYSKQNKEHLKLIQMYQEESRQNRIIIKKLIEKIGENK